MLKLNTFLRKQDEAHKILARALPAFAESIDPRTIEVADFSLTNPEYRVGRIRVGQIRESVPFDQGTINRVGLELVVIANVASRQVLQAHDDVPALKSGGYCGKYLIWTPNQYLPMHSHEPTIILPNSEDIPKAILEKLVDLKQRNPDFEKADERPGFSLDNFSYYVPVNRLSRDDLARIHDYAAKHGGEIVYGKGETFTVLHGGGWLIAPSINRAVCESRYYERPISDFGMDQRIPSTELEIMAQQGYELYKGGRQISRESIIAIEMNVGRSYEIPPGHPHAVLAGPNGNVSAESSAPSFDPGDIFFDGAIQRATKIAVPLLDGSGSFKVVLATDYFREMGYRVSRG